MTLNYTSAVGIALWALVSPPMFAQQTGTQAPATPPAATVAPSASPLSCAQNSQGVARGLDILSGRIEEARQTNDAVRMRAALADLEVAFAQMRTQLAECTRLTEAGSGAMATMPGMDHSKMAMPGGAAAVPSGSTAADAKPAMPAMDHSKMQMPPKPPTASGSRAPAPPAKSAAPMPGMDHTKMQTPATQTSARGAQMDHSKMAGQNTAPAANTPSNAARGSTVLFTLRTEPAPPRNGANDFEVTLKDATGRPISDAEVSLEFSMPAMPSMRMPEAKLQASGNGIYKGSATMGMAGNWDVTVKASHHGQPLDAKKMRLTAR